MSDDKPEINPSGDGEDTGKHTTGEQLDPSETAWTDDRHSLRDESESLGSMSVPLSKEAVEAKNTPPLWRRRFSQFGEAEKKEPTISGKDFKALLEQVQRTRIKAVVWVASTIISTLIGFWMGDLRNCLPTAKAKAHVANESTGYLGKWESCFFLPSVVVSDSGRLAAERAINEAEEALKACRVRCWIGSCCEEVKREILLAKANFDLLSGRCKQSLERLTPLYQSAGLSPQEAITWAWAKVEATPNDRSYQEALNVLGSVGSADACVATTKGSLLRRRALLREHDKEKLLRAALAEHERAVLLNPQSFLADYNRAIVFVDLGNIEAAQAALDSAKDHLGQEVDPYWHMAQARIFELRNENDKVLNELSTAVETGYQDPEFRLARAWMLLRQGQSNDAERDFKRAEEILNRKETSCSRSSQSAIRAEMEWGMALAQYKKDGFISPAIDKLRKAVSKSPDSGLSQDIEADLRKLEDLLKVETRKNKPKS